MAKPRAFISFDFDHNEKEKNLFVGQGKHPDTPWEIEDWSSKTSLPQSQWEKLIQDKINRCNMVIVNVAASVDQMMKEGKNKSAKSFF